jgi:ferric-dicitrate binding protein FerR (iron transport regulator)
MTHSYIYPDGRGTGQDHDDLFRNLEIPFTRSREEAWLAVERRLEASPQHRTFLRTLTPSWIAAAAAIVLLVATGLVMRYYSTGVVTLPTQQLTQTLPDGSSVTLNAGSEMRWNPLWWRFSRQVAFSGEAYFEVKPGSRFNVISDKGTTSVLGTSFNIFARDKDYRVVCLTGKVKVTSPSREEVILTPEYQAVIVPGGSISVTRQTNPENATSWTAGRFSFASEPLRSVLDEIERQYGIVIRMESPGDRLYTGYFSREKSAGEVIGLVCKPFGLTFAENPEGVFIIKN